MFVQYCGEEFDKSILRKPTYPVNLRLMIVSKYYKEIIEHISQFLLEIATQKNVIISAPTIGFPFSIIAGRVENRVEVFLNPVIIDKSAQIASTKTNCSCIDLKEPISCSRYEWIVLEYYDINLKKIKTNKLFSTSGGYGLQHEMDHLSGILITDFCTDEKLDTLWKKIPGV